MTTLDAAPIPAPSDYERTDARALPMRDVVAQLVQNVCGGAGAGVAVAALQWLAGVPLDAHWRWPVGVGVLVAGASTAVRAYIDEYRSERRWRAREAQHALEMQAMIDDAEAAEAAADYWQGECERLEAELARTQNELRAERYAANAARADSRHIPVQHLFDAQHRRDAHELLRAWYAKNTWPGERSMGWPRSRHSAASDLIRRAICDGAPPSGRPPHSEAWAIARLDAWLGSASNASTPRRDLEVSDALDAATTQPGEGGEG